MNNINNYQQKDSLLRLINDFILATVFIGLLIWTAWMIFYFHIGIGQSIGLVINNKVSLIRPFFMMCFASSFFLNAFLFNYFSKDTSKKDKHHRGASLED